MAGTFELQGKRYELATLESLTFDEARELKRISGYTPETILLPLAESDPDAWLGIFAVSARRADASLGEASFADERLVALMETIEGERQSPPAQAAPEAESQQAPASVVPAASEPTSAGPGAEGAS